MDVRIGIADSNQVVELELADDTDRAALKKQVDKALADSASVLWLVDRKGKELAVPASRIGFVEMASVDPDRRIGFG